MTQLTCPVDPCLCLKNFQMEVKLRPLTVFTGCSVVVLLSSSIFCSASVTAYHPSH
jgi:hypothetical protein